MDDDEISRQVALLQRDAEAICIESMRPDQVASLYSRLALAIEGVGEISLPKGLLDQMASGEFDDDQLAYWLAEADDRKSYKDNITHILILRAKIGALPQNQPISDEDIKEILTELFKDEFSGHDDCVRWARVLIRSTGVSYLSKLDAFDLSIHCSYILSVNKAEFEHGKRELKFIDKHRESLKSLLAGYVGLDLESTGTPQELFDQVDPEFLTVKILALAKLLAKNNEDCADLYLSTMENLINVGMNEASARHFLDAFTLKYKKDVLDIEA